MGMQHRRDVDGVGLPNITKCAALHVRKAAHLECGLVCHFTDKLDSYQSDFVF